MNYKHRLYLNKIFSITPLNYTYYLIKDLISKKRHELRDPDEVMLFHRDNILNYKGTRTIEIGAGQHLAQNIFLKQFLDYQYLTDIRHLLSIKKVNRVLKKYNLDQVKSSKDLERYGIEYIAPFNILNDKYLENKEINFFISTSTFEHIPKKDLELILIKLRSTLLKESYLSLHIDYSDHFSHGDPSIGRNNFLKYSEQEFKKFNTWIIYQNRLRHHHYKELFIKSGFQIIEEHAKNFHELPDKVNYDNLTGNDDDLATTGRWVLKNI